MNNVHKVEYQEHRISELEKQVLDLEKENKSLMVSLEQCKITLTIKDEIINNLKKEIENIKAIFSADIDNTRLLQGYLKETLSSAKLIVEGYSKDVKIYLSQMRSKK